MKKKWVTAIIVSALCLTGLSVGGYVYVKDQLKDKFAPNTWVNGIYCTGRTAEEINRELLANLKAPVVTVEDDEGSRFSYDLSEAGYGFDYSLALETYQKHQASEGWVEMAKQENRIITGDPVISYDEAKLKDWWKDLSIVKQEETKPVLEMKLEDQGYVLKSTLEEHLDVEKGLSELLRAVSEKEEQVLLKDADCYFDYEMNEAQKETYEIWQEAKALEKCGLTYDMGAELIVFDEALMSRFIAKDEKGNPLRDENGKFYYDLETADTYMDELCESYHTYGVERPFKTSRENGEIVMVKPGNFGTEIDKAKEKAFLREILTDDALRLQKTVHQPVYLHETSYHGLDDTGGTYIEVDKKEQKIYFYKDHELMITSGVVTGNVRGHHDTNEGAFHIQAKYKNRVLRGPGYASFVRRWMPIYKSIGLHDANWRKEEEFGGDTYLKNGSHGCVNMPDETTDIIFENAEIGTPVFIFQ